MRKARSASSAGFTLIEMIASLAIVGIFMTLMMFHVVGLSNIWLQGSDDDFFDQHVDGVRLFLSQAFEQAETNLEANLNNNGDSGGSTPAGLSSEALPVHWAHPPGWFDMDPPLLHFRQEQAPALFVREGAHLPRIRAFLYFEQRQGLAILWYSDMEVEAPERVEDLNLTMLSPFVTRLEYAYYDSEDERWETTERPLSEEDDAYILPHFLKLHFEHQGETRERLVYIPQRLIEMPLF
jgi:prepilin-type N-terminal cleavage/methylation domain-containing protein